MQAAREAGDAGFDVPVACAFNYEAHTTEFNNLGRIPVLKARMNADLHMAGDLKNTGKGNLFVIMGEPDSDLLETRGWLVWPSLARSITLDTSPDCNIPANRMASAVSRRMRRIRPLNN